MTSYHMTSVELEPDEGGERPTVVAAARWDGKVWALTVDCPYRGKAKHWAKAHTHPHGGGSDPRRIYLGHRGADCDSPGNRGYNLTLGTVAGPETN